MNPIHFDTFLLVVTFVVVVIEGEEPTADENMTKVTQYPIKTGSQCFHVKGVPTLKLRCPGGELIKVTSSFYGAPPRNTTCEFNRTENHCIQLTDLQENCMGRYMCSVYVSNPFLMNCRTYANYMQVNYTCIPKANIHDICSGVNVNTHHGFLRTPNYPDANYTSNLHCACRMKTKGRSVNFKIHDFSLNHTKAGICDTDFLQVSGWGKKCGHLGPERLPETLEINKQDILIEFKTDDLYQSRGFWMEFTSRKETALTCGLVKHKGSTPKEPSNESLSVSPSENGRGPDLVLLDSSGEDSTPLWTVKPGTKPKDEPGTPFGNWVPHDDGEDTAFEDSKTKKSDTNKSLGNTVSNVPTKDEKEISVGKDNEEEDEFDTYDFNETQAFSNKIDSVQMITGIVVGLLILIAVIIIIVLVFRR